METKYDVIKLKVDPPRRGMSCLVWKLFSKFFNYYVQSKMVPKMTGPLAKYKHYLLELITDNLVTGNNFKNI